MLTNLIFRVHTASTTLTWDNWNGHMPSDTHVQSEPWLIIFYIKTSVTCISTLATFEAAAELVGDDVSFGKVDANVEKKLTEKYDINQFPLVVFWLSNRKTEVLQRYIGRHTVEDYTNFCRWLQNPIQFVDTSLEADRITRESQLATFILIKPSSLMVPQVYAEVAGLFHTNRLLVASDSLLKEWNLHDDELHTSPSSHFSPYIISLSDEVYSPFLGPMTVTALSAYVRENMNPVLSMMTLDNQYCLTLGQKPLVLAVINRGITYFDEHLLDRLDGFSSSASIYEEGRQNGTGVAYIKKLRSVALKYRSFFTFSVAHADHFALYLQAAGMTVSEFSSPVPKLSFVSKIGYFDHSTVLEWDNIQEGLDAYLREHYHEHEKNQPRKSRKSHENPVDVTKVLLLIISLLLVLSLPSVRTALFGWIFPTESSSCPAADAAGATGASASHLKDDKSEAASSNGTFSDTSCAAPSGEAERWVPSSASRATGSRQRASDYEEPHNRSTTATTPTFPPHTPLHYPSSSLSSNTTPSARIPQSELYVIEAIVPGEASALDGNKDTRRVVLKKAHPDAMTGKDAKEVAWKARVSDREKESS